MKPKSIKVVFLTPVFPSKEDNISGIFIKRLVDMLYQQGLDIVVINPVPFGYLPKILLPKKINKLIKTPFFEETELGVSVYRPRYFSYPKSTIWGFASLFIYISISTLIKKLNPDIVHSHFLYPMGAVGNMLKSAMGIPHICTIRGSDINVFPTISVIQKNKAKRVLKGADYLTSVSKALADKAFAIAGVQSKVIYNGFDINLIKDNINKYLLRDSLSLDTQAFIALYVGSIKVEKGINELLEAFSSEQLNHIQLTIIGDINVPLKISGKLHHHKYLGMQTQENVFKYMLASDVLILPSHNEGMPNVLVEAATLGLPIISTAVGGVPELINEETGYFIDIGSSDSIKRVVLEVFNNYQISLEKANRLKIKIKNDFNAVNNTKIFIDIYKDLIKFRPTEIS
jgi:teichuronic acid biosynthesis glycosyltransferase TuaC